jgi:hypothetical protein
MGRYPAVLAYRRCCDLSQRPLAPTDICFDSGSLGSAAGKSIVRVEGLFMLAFIDRLSFSTRVVVVVFIFLIVAAVIFELEIPSWERLVALRGE